MNYKSLVYNVFFLFALCILDISCTDETEQIQSTLGTRTRSAEGIGSVSGMTATTYTHSVLFQAQLTGWDEETHKLRTYGFCFSTMEEVPSYKFNTETNTKRVSTRNIDADGLFSYEFNNVELEQTYWVRAWVILQDRITDNIDTLFSEVTSFKIDLTVPSIETMPVVNRSKMGAVVFARFKDAGNIPLSKWGICLSERPNPTPDDIVEYARDTCKFAAYHGEFGAFFQELTPSRLYHTRAFVITEDGKTVYSEDRIFRTTRGGDYAWSWASNREGAVSDGAAERIEIAMDSAAYYYNNYSNLYLRARVEYNTGVPTADCSFGGWIRFGANSRYQWVGTAQHETAHGLGVGTTSDWGTHLSSGVWIHPIAQRTLRAVMHDQSQEIHGDTQHFWPGGINQREEVTNGTTNSYGESIRNERMLRANAMILNAMRLDGLWGPGR